MSSSRLRVLLVVTAFGWASQPRPGSAQTHNPGATQPASGLGPDRGKLPELPRTPAIEVARPGAADLAEVDALLGRLTSDDADREGALRELLESMPRHVDAIRFRLGAISDATDKDALKRLLLKTRREGLEQKADEVESDKAQSGVDYLARLCSHPNPKSEAWRDLVSVLALSRMLEAVGTVEAVRGLVDVYARFGEFLRVTTQHALARLGERAVPALIEAERHPAPKIAKWAVRQLDLLGKVIPSEAVQTQDQGVLADVLRAYGRTRNPEALRIVVSFANSERAQIREAARQAVALTGEVGAWQLRDTYENVVGKKPARDWSWERTARELFAEFDKLRLAEVGRLFEQGQAAQARGDLSAMRANFDQLLARSPSFERQKELAAGYLAFAQAELDKSRPQALAALRRAERLDPQLRAASSLRLTLEAEDLEERGIADATLLQRALDLDSANHLARSVLVRFERGEPRRSERARVIAAAAMMGAAAMAIAFILLRRPRRLADSSHRDDASKPSPEAPSP